MHFKIEEKYSLECFFFVNCNFFRPLHLLNFNRALQYNDGNI